MVILCSGCVDKKLAVVSKGLSDGRYDSEFPSRNASDEIALITRSVKKIYCVSSYTTYQFRKEARITSYDIWQGRYKKAAWGTISTTETTFGTATIIGSVNSHIALLTCAHIIHSHDTLITWYETSDEDPQIFIKSFSVKNKQENWVKDFSRYGSFSVLASDINSDIAILGVKSESQADTVPVFPYPAGHAKELEWGSFVYAFGYPLGNLVVTKGIVSLANNRPYGEFTLDALLNKGCSGGIILAIRDGVPNFELVGLVRNVNSSIEQFLEPAAADHPYPGYIPYRGDVFVGDHEMIQYGLNSVVTAEAIQEFYHRNRTELLRSGYDLDTFFREKGE